MLTCLKLLRLGHIKCKEQITNSKSVNSNRWKLHFIDLPAKFLHSNTRKHNLGKHERTKKRRCAKQGTSRTRNFPSGFLIVPNQADFHNLRRAQKTSRVTQTTNQRRYGSINMLLLLLFHGRINQPEESDRLTANWPLASLS